MNELGNVGFGLESINLCTKVKLPPRVKFTVHKLYLNKAVFFFKALPSNNIEQQLVEKT